MELPSQFRYVLCPAVRADSKYSKEYNEIYNCWREVWDLTLKELNYPKKFYSDGITKQDFIGALFDGETCIGLCFFRWLDTSRPEFYNDSYFYNWSESNKETLFSRGRRIVTCTQLAVRPLVRGRAYGFSTKELMMGLMTETFLNSNADSMAGAMRVDRGVSASAQRWGATPIAIKVPCEYCEDNTDLVGFFRDKISLYPKHELKDSVTQLWKNKLQIKQTAIENIFEKTVIDSPKHRMEVAA